jgi:hypothetical protein
MEIIYWISTALLCVTMLFSAGSYLFNYEMASQFYTNLGLPTEYDLLRRFWERDLMEVG